MSFTSSTNRWASRIVIVLQLTTWSAVSIILLQKGVSSLQRRRMLETIDHVAESTQSGDHRLAGMDQRIDNLEGGKASRIIRDRERILEDDDDDDDDDDDNGASTIIHAGKNIVARLGLVSEPVSQGNATGRDTDLSAENASMREPHGSYVRGKADEPKIASTRGNGKSRTSFSSRMSDGGTTAAIAMVVIGAIMLLLGPTVIVLRILDERKQARKLVATAREDPPPAYEQAVFMNEEAPRYSTLSLNHDHSTSPSCSAAAELLIKPNPT